MGRKSICMDTRRRTPRTIIMSNIYEQLSNERKKLQAEGQLPDWMTTGGWQTFRKSLYNATGLRDTYERISRTAARHTNNPAEWEKRFFEVLWKGYLACSTPVLSNMGTPKGCPVSCSGAYIHDSIDGFYSTRHETAMLTKNGFGTSAYLGDIRPRGADISSGGKASGVLDVVEMFVDDMRKVAQGGNQRRGAWAGYLPLDHGDFYELASFLEKYPDDANIGWVISDAFVDRLKANDQDAHERFQRMMKVRAVTGKGYILLIDNVNAQNPEMYEKHGLRVKASNLCIEIALHSDSEHTFTCVLSSMNLAKYDEWKNTDAVFVSTVFLDCVASEFLELARKIPGMERAVRFTEKSRALGLGALGYHTYLQKNMIAFESFKAHRVNNEIFNRMKKEAIRASQWMAKEWGEPEWCKGFGQRNTHLLAVAPNTSSALICGGVSQGIEPLVAISYIQPTSAGDIVRLNPVFIEFCKSKGIELTQGLIDDINEHKGSVQHWDFLSDHEKAVFKTAYEINQNAIIRKASARQRRICQGQSLNLFFNSDEDEAVIAAVHQRAITDKYIKGVYYMRTQSGVGASTGEVCRACEG